MTDYQRIEQAIDFIKHNFKRQPSLNEIAENVHLSPFHFQRLFKKWAGVSPKKFLQYVSLEHAKKMLTQSTSLQEVTFETGLSGTGRLHDLFVNIEGMTPGEYKNKGENLTINFSFNSSNFGDYLVASTHKGICNLFFYDRDVEAVEELHKTWPNAHIIENEVPFHTQIAQFFRNDLTLQNRIPLHLKGTTFQLKVWEALLKIPEGALASYGDVADFISHPAANRAVGTSIGCNPVAYLIPCHRVIKSVGGIGEYRWGQNRKMAIIGWEAAKVSERVAQSA